MVSFEISYSPHTSNLKFHHMGESPKHCRFPASQNTHFTYICTKNEVCCENGCCITSLRRMAEFWYFWLILISVCIAFLFCMHYYNKLRLERDERRFLNRRRGRVRRFVQSSEMYGDAEEFEMDQEVMVDVHDEAPARRRCVAEPFESSNSGGGEINELLLEHLIVTYQNRNNMLFNNIINVPTATPPPPDYNSVVKDEIYEPPPKYSDACLLIDKSDQVDDVAIVHAEEVSVVQQVEQPVLVDDSPPPTNVCDVNQTSTEELEHEDPCHDC